MLQSCTVVPLRGRKCNRRSYIHCSATRRSETYAVEGVAWIGKPNPLLLIGHTERNTDVSAVCVTSGTDEAHTVETDSPVETTTEANSCYGRKNASSKAVVNDDRSTATTKKGPVEPGVEEASTEAAHSTDPMTAMESDRKPASVGLFVSSRDQQDRGQGQTETKRLHHTPPEVETTLLLPAG